MKKSFESHRKNFAKSLEFIGRSRNRWTVFNDFLAITAISIANSCDPYNSVTSQDIQKEREKSYLEIFNKYSTREQKLLLSMFAELVMEMENHSEHLVDVLGELYQELNFNDEWKGQFFTPQPVSDFMGRLAFNDKAYKEKGYITVHEPCCGGGSIIYGFANAMREAGLNYQKDSLIFANDIDERCVFMTYIQCSFYGIPAIVQQKDMLQDKVLGDAWFTPMFILYSWRWKNVLNKEMLNYGA